MVKSCEIPHEKSPFCWCFHSAAQLLTGCLLGTGDSAGAKVWTYGRSTWSWVHPVMAVSQIGAEKSARIYHYIYIFCDYMCILKLKLNYTLYIYIYVCVWIEWIICIYIYICTYIGCLVLYDLSSNMVSWKIQHLNRCFSRIFHGTRLVLPKCRYLIIELGPHTHMWIILEKC